MTDLPESELRSLLTTQKYRLATLNNFYNADNTNPAAGDAAAIDIAQAIRVLVNSNEALLRQLLPDFEDCLIAFSPKPGETSAGRATVTRSLRADRGVPQDVVIMANNRMKYDRKKMTPDIPRVPVRDWWNQPSWDSGTNSISNREIVLGLANKDGGAHIDGSGYPNYRKAKEQGQLFFGQRMSNIGKMGHLAAIAGERVFSGNRTGEIQRRRRSTRSLLRP